MINAEHKLTADDLIMEYIIYKVKNGYEPQFLLSEFMTFLNYFKSKKEVFDTIDDGEKLFNRFFKRKNENDWYENYDTKRLKGINSKPHLNMEYLKEKDDYIIRANYLLSDYDKSCINTYFMDNGNGKYDDYKGEVYNIRLLIKDFLSTEPKRTLDENVNYSADDLKIGKYITAEIIEIIWDNYITNLINNHKWPEQCKNINKYLLEIDLANIIGIKSIRNKLIELYSTLSKRIAIMYNQDRNLKISSYSNFYLALANYKLLIQGFEEIFETTFGKYKKALEIDLSKLILKESHEIDGIYNYDEDPDVKTTITNIENNNIKKLVRVLDQENKKR